MNMNFLLINKYQKDGLKGDFFRGFVYLGMQSRGSGGQFGLKHCRSSKISKYGKLRKK